MNYIYLIPSRYPTEKAYGVTIGNSLKSLRELGSEVSIVTWNINGIDEYGNTMRSVHRRAIRISPIFYNKLNKFFSAVAFLLNQLLFGLYFMVNTNLRSENSIIWVREPVVLLPLIFSAKKINFMIEIHHKVSQLEKWIIRIIKRRHNVTIIVIDKSSAAYHRRIFKSTRIFEVPMGVPQNFFCLRKNLRNEYVTFGYLGKCSSSGHDNKISEIIEAGHELKQFKNIKFKFIGLESHCKNELMQRIKKLGLDQDLYIFHDHVKHDQIPLLLESIDYGILPYEGTPYNLERFPLKILEYMASGLPVVATNIKPHIELLRTEFTFFYDFSEIKGLATAILRAYNARDSYVSMSQYARIYAESFTYDKRVKLIDEIMNRV